MSSIENSYHRPNFPYRCGRAAVWEKPCPNGPNVDGSCGGTAACEPKKTGGRFVCKRRPEHGGTCALGPLPDGTCALRQPACQPRRTLRAFRLRLTLISLIAVVAVIGAFGAGGTLVPYTEFLFRDPGPILDVHAAEIDERGCATCHQPHGLDSQGFLLAAFRPSGPSKGVVNKCLDCHVITKTAGSVHKLDDCALCHAEHKGAIAPVTTITDQQCHSCHKTKFTTFAASHPRFGDTFPYTRRTAINFDHVKHLDIHFKDARYAAKVPEGRCIGCHVASKATWQVPIKSFAEACAGCHEEQIATRDMVLLNLPEMEKNVFDPAAVAEACPGVAPEKADVEYESASLDPVNPILAALLGVDGGDISAYQDKIGALFGGILSDGIAPLSALVKKADGRPSFLLNGLSPTVLHAAACKWAANTEYAAPAGGGFGGWNAGEFSLRYRAVRHQDPLLAAWLDFAASAEIEDLSKALLHAEGPGTCVKCHSVSETDAVRVEWRSAGTVLRDNHTYSHAPHLNVLGPESQCETCHVLNRKADYAAAYKQTDPKVFSGNFAKIGNRTCAACHREGQVAEGCLTCHKYHEQTGFKMRMMAGNHKKQRADQ